MYAECITRGRKFIASDEKMPMLLMLWSNAVVGRGHVRMYI